MHSAEKNIPSADAITIWQHSIGSNLDRSARSAKSMDFANTFGIFQSWFLTEVYFFPIHTSSKYGIISTEILAFWEKGELL